MENFILKANEKHKSKYSYNKVVFKNLSTKVIITCPIHGNFEQMPKDHLKGKGCPDCAKNKTLSLEEFKEKANEIHNGKYNYDKVVFTKLKENITVVCPIHGDFEQKASLHLAGKGCRDCAGNRKYDLSRFIEKAKIVHNNKYDYSKTILKSLKDKVIITCPIHGDFEQIAKNHIDGFGCAKCGNRNIILSNDEFISRANLVHNNYYSYEKTSYKTINEKLIITCPVHGDFEQIARNHLYGAGCRHCAGNAPYNREIFINKANIIHNNYYTYDKINEISNNKNIVIITCPIHGDFEQVVLNHIAGQGCPKCFGKTSKNEKEVLDFIKSFYDKEIIENSREFFKDNDVKYELDIFIPEFNLGIEYNGNFWHSEQQKGKNYHFDKYKASVDRNIELLNIYSHQWINQKEIIKSIIKTKLGLFDKIIYARKCKIKIIDKELEKHFLNENHLQGYVYSTICFGLFYENELISLMSFGESRFEKDKLELLRLVTKINTKAIGGSEKLFKHFLKSEFFNKDLITYSSNDHFSGKIYEKLGFKYLGFVEPSYYYFHLKEESLIYSRQMFQKHKLKDKLINFDENLTEYENMLRNGYDRVWNAGNKKFIYEKK